MKDSPLKEHLLRHFWAQKCFVQPEVNIYFSGGLSGSQKLITDVDVFAFRPTPNLTFERILGDCKTEKGQSPINRVLWLSGLMGYVGAASGQLLLNTRDVERDHKLAATELQILLLNERDFEVYDRSILYPSGSGTADIAIDDFRILQGATKRFPRLTPLTEYTYRDCFRKVHFGNQIRLGISVVRSVAKELDPSRAEHLALLCDSAAALAIHVAECCGILFHQYLHPEDKQTLSESLKVLIWGGRESYDFNNALRQKLYARKGATADDVPALELPEWNRFLQLIRSMLEQPLAAFRVPWVLRHLAFDVILHRRRLETLSSSDASALHQAMLLLAYVCRASGAPREFENTLVDPLIRVQSRLLHEHETQGRSQPTKTQSASSQADSRPTEIPPAPPQANLQAEEAHQQPSPSAKRTEGESHATHPTPTTDSPADIGKGEPREGSETGDFGF